MKKTLLTNLKFIALGLVLAMGASYAHASWGGLTNSYSGPSASFPNNNASTPVYVNSTDQVKAGSLSIGEWFIALANAQIDGTTFFTGGLRGGAPGTTVGTVRFGGPNVEVPTHVAVSGGVANTNYTVQSNPLANPTDGAVCADETGTLVLCDPAVWTTETGALEPMGSVLISFRPNQVGDAVTIRNNATGQIYTVNNTTVPTVVSLGSYTITAMNWMCLDTGTPIPFSDNATAFGLSEDSPSFIITFNSCQ
ncbi:MAG: hypothetical protein ACOYMZ_01015 [Minisyncoccia bacterium]